MSNLAMYVHTTPFIFLVHYFYLLGPLNFATFQLSHPFPSVKQLKKLLGSESLLFPTQSKLRHCVQKPSVSSAGLFVPAFPDRHVGNFLPAANNSKAVPI